MVKEIENKLNKEYKLVGKVSINVLHEEEIPISSIDYVHSVMEKINPIKNNEPIIVVKKYYYSEKYDLIDGYHRLKHKLTTDNKIKVIVLDEYSIKRNNDSLFSFLEKLVGESIKFLSDEVIVVGDKYYQIEANEGCGGCGNGWSSLDVLPEFINKKITIKTVEQKGKDGDDLYDLYINGKLIAKVDTGYGNGYYGGDFQINITE